MVHVDIAITGHVHGSEPDVGVTIQLPELLPQQILDMLYEMVFAQRDRDLLINSRWTLDIALARM